MNSTLKNRLILLAIAVAVLAAGAYAWTTLRPQGPGNSLVSGHGRIEAIETVGAAMLGGRLPSLVVQ